MHGTQKVVSAVTGLVIVVGGFGCRQLARSAADEVTDRTTERAVEEAYDDAYKGPDLPDLPAREEVGITTTSTTSTPTEATTEPVPEDRGTDLPEGWPAELKLVPGLVVESASDVTGPGVVGTVAGELTAVTDGVRLQLAAAGFTLDPARSTDPVAGGGGGVTVATGSAGTMTVLISPEAAAPGTLRVSYRLDPAA